jgi:hypothetical protein
MGARKKASAMRGMIGMPEQSKHEKMLSDMHSALYALGNKVRKPSPAEGEKLLPEALQQTEAPEVAAAKSHVETLHGHFKAAQKAGK